MYKNYGDTLTKITPRLRHLFSYLDQICYNVFWQYFPSIDEVSFLIVLFKERFTRDLLILASLSERYAGC